MTLESNDADLQHGSSGNLQCTRSISNSVGDLRSNGVPATPPFRRRWDSGAPAIPCYPQSSLLTGATNVTFQASSSSSSSSSSSNADPGDVPDTQECQSLLGNASSSSDVDPGDAPTSNAPECRSLLSNSQNDARTDPCNADSLNAAASAQSQKPSLALSQQACDTYDEWVPSTDLEIPEDVLDNHQLLDTNVPPSAHSSPDKRRHGSGSSRKKNPSGSSTHNGLTLHKFMEDPDVDLEDLSRKLCPHCNVRSHLVLFVLTLVNILNYIDRYSIAGEFSPRSSF